MIEMDDKVDPARWCFLKLLDNRIEVDVQQEATLDIIDDDYVPEVDGDLGTKMVKVQMEYAPEDDKDFPIITMNNSGGGGFIEKYEVPVYGPLDSSDPDFDANNPNGLYIQNIIMRSVYGKTMELHVWSFYSDERDYIIQIIPQLIELAQDNHYSMCANYDQDTQLCETTGNPCDTLTNQNFQAINGKCPFPYITDPTDPNYRNPNTFFEIAGIYEKQKVSSRGPMTVDQTDITPPIYHTVISVDYEIYVDRWTKTAPFTKLETVQDEVLKKI